MLLEGTRRIADEPHPLITVAGVGTPSRRPPAGPVTCHWQAAGLPLLELVRFMFPRNGLPEKVTDWLTGGPTEPGVKSAVTGVSDTVIVL